MIGQFEAGAAIFVHLLFIQMCRRNRASQKLTRTWNTISNLKKHKFGPRYEIYYYNALFDSFFGMNWKLV